MRACRAKKKKRAKNQRRHQSTDLAERISVLDLPDYAHPVTRFRHRPRRSACRQLQDSKVVHRSCILSVHSLTPPPTLRSSSSRSERDRYVVAGRDLARLALEQPAAPAVSARPEAAERGPHILSDRHRAAEALVTMPELSRELDARWIVGCHPAARTEQGRCLHALPRGRPRGRADKRSRRHCGVEGRIAGILGAKPEGRGVCGKGK